MIIDEMIEIGVSGLNIKHFEERGYVIPRYYDSENRYHVKKGTKIMVHSYDLMPSSKILIHAKCDCPNCNKIVEIPFSVHYRSVKNTGSYYCSECKNQKSKKSLIEHFQNDPQYKEDVISKRKKTCIDKYGGVSPMASEEVREKVKNTIIDRFGSLNVFDNDEINQKKINTLTQKYGSMEEYYNHVAEKRRSTLIDIYNVPYYSMTDEYSKKVRDTNIQRYGYPNPMQNPEIKQKFINSLYIKNSAPSSKQQNYICDLLKLELNYPCESFFIDMADLSNNIAVEYDGSGHRLKVKLGVMDDNEFMNKQIIRDIVLKRNGYKIIRIICPNDLIPSDEKIIEMYSFAKEYFNTTNHTWIEFYPQENKYCNAEYKGPDGQFFDYGELRKVQKEEVV